MAPTLSLLAAAAGIACGAFFWWKDRNAKRALEKREQDISRRMYELAILKELGDRVGYSLDVQQIIDIITNSLHQFIDYSAVSYMLLEPEKVIFKMHLERSVHRRFVTDIRDRMLGSLSALLDRELKKESVQEILSGAILIEEMDEPVRSFFNIPLVIDEKVVGVLTVADTKGGLYKEEEMTILYKIIQQASKAVTSLQSVVKVEQAKLSAMVESIEDGIVMTDIDYRVLVVNPAAKRVIGLESKKEITIFDFIDNLGGKVDIRGRLEESVKLNKSYMSENFFIRDRFYQAFIFPVKTTSTLAAGEVLGGVVIFHDVTHEVELERVREDFTSMLVHELRTPLDNIRKLSEALKRPAKRMNSASQKNYLTMIYQNSSGMLNLVNDILDVAKLQSGKFELTLQSASITEVIQSRLDFFAVSAADKKIALGSRVSEDLPKLALFDAERIKEVLNNLLSNALKYTADGGSVSIAALMHGGGNPAAALSKLHVRLPAELPLDLSPGMLVAVYDTGIGIPREKMGDLFSKFKQLSGSSFTNVKGTGLGLAIAKGLVEQHGGSIGVASREGVGTVFYFLLPSRDAGVQSSLPPEPANAEKTAAM